MLLMSCANKAIQAPQCDVYLWLLSDGYGCVERKHEDKVLKKCPGDPDYPFLIGITPEDFACMKNREDALQM